MLEMKAENRSLKSILVTGGSGFIGSNFIRYLFQGNNFEGRIVNIDKLTYAGNPENLKDLHKEFNGTRYFFERVDICDSENLEVIFEKFNIDCIVHFAAESHVDRSIYGPKDFIETNIMGTFSLLEIARKFWKDKSDVLFHHISTDEVYGSLGTDGYFFETTAYDPRSPYSASKASSDHLLKAYHHTYNLPITLSNCSNNYGPFQFPEKLIPLMILNAIKGNALPVYGDGKNIRDWLYVEDHCSAIWEIIREGKTGETYNIGGENELPNIDVVHKVCHTLESLFPIRKNPNITDVKIQSYQDLITFVKDRPGHDQRYAINCDKIKTQLNWNQSLDFEKGLEKTIHWYLTHNRWIEDIRSGKYMEWIEKNYLKRS
jgi:dTDP-glucose 4,6-dehydratase